MERVLELLSARRGHFLLESGHHGDLWLDLETLCLRPWLVRSVAHELAGAVAQFSPDVICGPLIEGAFVGLIVSLELDLPFVYSERFARPAEGGLFPAGYRLPAALRGEVRGRRVAIVNDVINAGSAVRGTYADLVSCSADVVGIGSLLVLGSAAQGFADCVGIPLKSVAAMANSLWTAEACPLCADGVVLEDAGGFSASLAVQS